VIQIYDEFTGRFVHYFFLVLSGVLEDGWMYILTPIIIDASIPVLAVEDDRWDILIREGSTDYRGQLMKHDQGQ
ncbi:hypothetical protein ACJX0J_020755, partial [Zea mays]